MATVSSSPDTTTTNPTTTSTNPAANPPSHLAKLLSDALADAESLREDLKKERKRAENAERLASALQTVHAESNGTSATSPPPANHASSSSTQPPVNVEKITQLLTEFQARAERAERERDEEYARRAAISDAWYQLGEYIDSVDFAMKDMRAGFHRIVVDGGGILTPVTIPIPKNRGARSYQPSSSSLSSLPLPPAPSTRRPRTPSLEHAGQPPSKRPRSDYPDRSPYPPPQQSSYSSHLPPPVNPPQQQSRMVFHNQTQPPRSSSSQYTAQSTTHQFIPQTGQPSRQPQHRRASSGSSESASVDEMILEAADGSQATQASNGQLSPESNSRSRKRRASPADREVTYESHQRMSSHQQPPPPIPRTDFNSPIFRMQNGSLHNLGPMASESSASGQREIQMHVFAPVVTGAPQKKAKFSGASIPSLSTASVGGTSMIMSGPTTAGIDSASSPPSGSYPAQNEQGQRICRQCGMPGRYKDGKCVEKWGPGPCGPGTVCDRQVCRKKMKRVERRGTLEQLQQQQLQQQSSAQRQAYGSQPLSFSPATPSHSSNALTRTDTLPANFDQPSTQTTQPPPRIIHPPTHSNGRSSSPYGHSPSSTSHGVDAEIPTSSVRDGPPEKTVTRLSQPRPSSRQTSRSRDSRSPSNIGRRDSGTQSTDVEDADGEAEGDDDAEAEGEAEIAAAARGEKQSEGKDKEHPEGGDTDRGDEEAELLEAVDAAEAKKA